MEIYIIKAHGEEYEYIIIRMFMREKPLRMKNKYYLTGSTVRKQKSSYPTIIRKPGKALITSSLPKYKDVCLNGSKVKCIMPYKS